MTTIDQLKVKIFADGADKAGMMEMYAKPYIKGMTTNPTLMRKAGINDYRAFERVLPSKVFEYAATGKPIWAGAAGYAAEFIGREVTNSAVFRPCDVDHAVRVFKNLALRTSVRSTFVAKYDRAQISKALAKDLLSVLTETRLQDHHRPERTQHRSGRQAAQCLARRSLRPRAYRAQQPAGLDQGSSLAGLQNPAAWPRLWWCGAVEPDLTALSDGHSRPAGPVLSGQSGA